MTDHLHLGPGDWLFDKLPVPLPHPACKCEPLPHPLEVTFTAHVQEFNFWGLVIAAYPRRYG